MTTTTLRPALLALTVALLWPVAGAMAASTLYLDIPGVPGGSMDPGHLDQIELQAFSWKASVSVGRDATGQRTVRTPNVQDIAWTQLGSLGSAVPLFGHGTTGAAVASAGFQIVDGASPGKSPWMVLSAKDSVVSSLSISGSNGISQQASINPARLSLTVDPDALGGTAKTKLVTSYDTGTGAFEGLVSRNPVANPSITPARAGLYLRLGTGNHQIAGDNTSFGHEQWIAIDSYDTSISTPSFPSVGGPTAGKPSFSDLSWSQRLDATAPAVLRNLLGGETIGQAALERVVINSKGRAVTVMQLSLSDVIFTDFDLKAQTGGDGTLLGMLTFGSYSQTNWLLGADGSRIGPFSTGYDLDRGVRIKGTLADEVAGFGGGNLDGTEVFNPPPIPEPQTWALLLAGLAGVLVIARRQGASRQA
jgi:type VI protein secretion system component Hcp